MKKTNYHMHTRFSDGKCEAADLVKLAYDKGFASIGFSEHSPLPFDNTFALREIAVGDYVKEIKSLKSQWKDRLHILCGMEMDYIPGISEGFEAKRKEWDLDYLIGSVHLVLNDQKDALWFIDGPSPQIYDDGLNVLFGGDIRKAVGAYFNQIMNMVQNERFEIIGHFDKIKMHNHERFFSENDAWYLDLVSQCIDLIAEKNIIIEINTRGIYKKRSDSTFPGNYIIKLADKKGIPLTLSSDAHKIDEIDALFPETLKMLQQLGIKELYFHNTSSWISQPIN